MKLLQTFSKAYHFLSHIRILFSFAFITKCVSYFFFYFCIPVFSFLVGFLSVKGIALIFVCLVSSVCMQHALPSSQNHRLQIVFVALDSCVCNGSGHKRQIMNAHNFICHFCFEYFFFFKQMLFGNKYFFFLFKSIFLLFFFGSLVSCHIIYILF